MKKLLDVGFPQGIITSKHWQAIAASGVAGVYCRCGNGNNLPDQTFAGNRDGARLAQLAVGAYHVGFPLPPTAPHPGRDAATQARMHFTSSGGLGSRSGEMPPALDLEWPMPVDWPKWGITAASVRAWALGYLTAAQALWKRSPVLYVYPDFWAHATAPGTGATDVELEALSEFDLWLARYEVASPGTIGRWGAPTVWQKSDGGGRLPSGKPVDEDVFLGDDGAWTEFLHG